VVAPSIYFGPDRRETVVLTEWQNNVEKSIVEMKASLDENTKATSRIEAMIDDINVKTTPVVASFDAMQAGIKTIGTIGTIGGKVAKVVIYAVAIGAFLKVLFTAGSFSEAVAAFWSTIGGGGSS
jgi:hypothetical protein